MLRKIVTKYSVVLHVFISEIVPWKTCKIVFANSPANINLSLGVGAASPRVYGVRIMFFNMRIPRKCTLCPTPEELNVTKFKFFISLLI